jgi:FkbM family methyltransferase
VLLPIQKLESEFGVKPGLVIHAGANLCQERDYYQRNGVSKVLWIEALESVVSEAQELLETYSGQEIIQGALWSKSNEDLVINVSSNNAESSSIFKFKWHEAINPHVGNTSRINIHTIKLDDLLQNYFGARKPEIALLVLDLQGAEYEALKGGLMSLSNVSSIHVEVSTIEMYEGQRLFVDIHDLLLKHGFILIEHDLNDSTYSGDALFVKSALVNVDFVSPRIPKAPKVPHVKIKNWIKFLLIKFGVSAELIVKTTRAIKSLKNLLKNKF